MCDCWRWSRWIFLPVFGVWQLVMLSFMSEDGVMLVTLPLPTPINSCKITSNPPFFLSTFTAAVSGPTSNDFNHLQSGSGVMNLWTRDTETRLRERRSAFSLVGQPSSGGVVMWVVGAGTITSRALGNMTPYSRQGDEERERRSGSSRLDLLAVCYL